MRKLAFLVMAAGIAGAAHSQVVFSNMNGSYSAFSPSAGLIGYDDYSSTAGGSSFVLGSLRFVGGVSTAGSTLGFFFFNAGDTGLTNVVQSFGTTLNTGGDFIWTISNINLVVPTNGIMAIATQNGALGRWFLNQNNPTVGTDDPNFGYVQGFHEAFELTAVPEPASMLALGAGIAALVAKRRKK